jgi:hypothetical protein
MSTPDASESAPARKVLAKPLLGIVLIVVALGAVAIGVARESSKSGAAETATVTAEQPQVVTVYYFHGETRCETCLAIESATERVVRGRFDEEVAAGTLRYEAVNYDAPAGRHFRDDYDLAFGSVVVQGVGEARPWENLAEVWSLVHDDPEKLEGYLVEHITPMLAGNG